MSKRTRTDVVGGDAKRRKGFVPEGGSIEGVSVEEQRDEKEEEGRNEKDSSSNKQSPMSALASELTSALTLASSSTSPENQTFCLGPPVDQMRLLVKRLRTYSIHEWDHLWIGAVLRHDPNRFLWVDFDREFSIGLKHVYLFRSACTADDWAGGSRTDAHEEEQGVNDDGFSLLGWCVFHLYNKCLRVVPKLLFDENSLSQAFGWGCSIWARCGSSLQARLIEANEQDIWSERLRIEDLRTGSCTELSKMAAWQQGFLSLHLPHAIYELRDFECAIPAAPIHSFFPSFGKDENHKIHGLILAYVKDELMLEEYVKEVPVVGTSLPIFTQQRLDLMFQSVMTIQCYQAQQRAELFRDLLSRLSTKLELASLVFQYCSLL